MIILLSEEVCVSWRFPCCMGNYIHNQMEWDVRMLVLLPIFFCLTIYNISLRGLSKSARRCACALRRAWRYFIYKDIEHNFRTEHECILLRLTRDMVSTVIFPYQWANKKHDLLVAPFLLTRHFKGSAELHFS
jgi:hypothetical protein